MRKTTRYPVLTSKYVYATLDVDEAGADTALFVGGPYHNQEMTVEEIEKLPEFEGKYSDSYEEAYAQGAAVPRPELWNKPKVRGYAGPMWDSGKLRYETWEVYDMLSR